MDVIHFTLKEFNHTALVLVFVLFIMDKSVQYYFYVCTNYCQSSLNSNWFLYSSDTIVSLGVIRPKLGLIIITNLVKKRYN